MTEEASALLKNFDTFIDNLAGDSAYGQQTESLTDAVNDYITFTSSRAEAIDYNLAVVTPTPSIPAGIPVWMTLVRPDSSSVRTRREPREDDEQHRFLQHVGCWSACCSPWRPRPPTPGPRRLRVPGHRVGQRQQSVPRLPLR